MVDKGSLGGAMQVGDLVRFDCDDVWIGVVIKIDYDFEYGMMYRVAFIEGDMEWCLEDDLEIICK